MRFLAWLLLACLSIVARATQADEITFFHNDVSGTPQAATDASGQLVWREHYRPYGERLDNAPAAANNQLWFTGKPHDAGTGLTYMGARYYDPMLGRFVGMDTEPFDEENLHSSNRYAYANNNPYKYVDQDGHSPIDVAFLIYDVGKLGVAIYHGDGVGSAAIDVAMSVVGVVSPVPGAGQALKAVRAVDKAVEVAKATEHVAEAARVAENAADVAKVASNVGRTGRQARLRELASDAKVSSADRGWIKNEMRHIKQGNRDTIRVPRGRELAHPPGQEAAKGYSYKVTNLQDKATHRLQHKLDNFGRRNKERPLNDQGH